MIIFCEVWVIKKEPSLLWTSPIFSLLQGRGESRRKKIGQQYLAWHPTLTHFLPSAIAPLLTEMRQLLLGILCNKYLSKLYPLDLSHHAEGLVQPKMYKKTVTGFRYPGACTFRKYQIENRLPSLALPLPTVFRTWFLLHKMWLKLANNYQKWNCLM
jgi:hypothetical protein